MYKSRGSKVKKSRLTKEQTSSSKAKGGTEASQTGSCLPRWARDIGLPGSGGRLFVRPDFGWFEVIVISGRDDTSRFRPSRFRSFIFGLAVAFVFSWLHSVCVARQL